MIGSFEVLKCGGLDEIVSCVGSLDGEQEGVLYRSITTSEVRHVMYSLPFTLFSLSREVTS